MTKRETVFRLGLRLLGVNIFASSVIKVRKLWRYGRRRSGGYFSRVLVDALWNVYLMPLINMNVRLGLNLGIWAQEKFFFVLDGLHPHGCFLSVFVRTCAARECRQRRIRLGKFFNI